MFGIHSIIAALGIVHTPFAAVMQIPAPPPSVSFSLSGGGILVRANTCVGESCGVPLNCGNGDVDNSYPFGASVSSSTTSGGATMEMQLDGSMDLGDAILVVTGQGACGTTVTRASGDFHNSVVFQISGGDPAKPHFRIQFQGGWAGHVYLKTGSSGTAHYNFSPTIVASAQQGSHTETLYYGPTCNAHTFDANANDGTHGSLQIAYEDTDASFSATPGTIMRFAVSYGPQTFLSTNSNDLFSKGVDTRINFDISADIVGYSGQYQYDSSDPLTIDLGYSIIEEP